MRSAAPRIGLAPAFLAAWGALGCAPSAPPRWAEGGAPLALGRAHWQREGGDVELLPDGRVLVDGDLTFVVDRVGRVTTSDYEPFALLLPDGQLVGTDHADFGRMGVSNASPPGALEAWLAVMPDGTVTYFDTDGERLAGGAWTGCGGPVHRTCTLVTQLLSLANYRGPRPFIGVGVGIGVRF